MEEEVVDESFFIEDAGQNTPDIELQKTGLENTYTERQIGSITKSIEPVSGQSSLDIVVEMFKNQADLEAVPIEETGSVIGVIERKTVEAATSTALKRFVAKNCIDYVADAKLTLNARDFCELVVDKVDEAVKATGIQNFVVLLNNRSYLGIVSADDVRRQIRAVRVHDLEKAKVIQQHLLPDDDSTKDFPFHVAIYNQMANAVGGDFYIAQRVSQTSFVIGSFDVSGKNVSAALLTVTIGSYFATLKQLVHSTLSAVQIATMLDRFLATVVPVGNFITGAICYIDALENQIEILNCGHTDVYACKKNARDEIQVATMKPTLPPFGMGAVADALKSSGKAGYRLALASGLQIDMYSDGLPDMQDDDGVRFDDENTKKFFIDLYNKDVSEMEKFTGRTVERWKQHAMLPDDITVVNLRF